MYIIVIHVSLIERSIATCTLNIFFVLQKVIISGKDGTILWRADMKNYEMSSDLTLQTTEPYRDLYLYKMKGRGAHVYKDLTGEIHGVGVQRNVRMGN